MDISILFVSPRTRIPQRRPYGFYELIEGVSKIVRRTGLVEPPPITNRPLPPSVTSYTVPVLNIMKHIDWPLPHVAKLVSIIKRLELEYDIVHFFSQNYPSSLCSIILKKPKIITIESFPGIDYDHGDFIVNTVSSIYSWTFTRIALSHVDGVISVSRSAIEVLKRLGLRPGHTARIPLGIDTSQIKPDEKLGQKVRAELGLREVVGIFLGRLSTVKGIVFLVKAMEELEKKPLNIDLLVVGDGPERRLFKRLTRNRHARVYILGFKPDPFRFLCASDFLVLPSLGEGCPNVVLEAFACGKPVIATSVGAIPDIVKHGLTGLIIKPKDVKGLVNAMYTMATDINRARAMGKNAREYAERELDWTVIIKRVLRFYEEILSDPVCCSRCAIFINLRRRQMPMRVPLNPGRT